eukprot:13690848-Alexandrium_andersonii.AAC.1
MMRGRGGLGVGEVGEVLGLELIPAYFVDKVVLKSTEFGSPCVKRNVFICMIRKDVCDRSCFERFMHVVSTVGPSVHQQRIASLGDILQYVESCESQYLVTTTAACKRVPWWKAPA